MSSGGRRRAATSLSSPDALGDRRDDVLRDLLLDGEHVLQRPVVSLGPQMSPLTASTSCAVMRTRFPARRTLPSTTYPAPSVRPTSRTSTLCPRNENEEFRAITMSSLKRDNSVITSSVMPSLKYTCSGSPLMFSNGKTAIVGLSVRLAPHDEARARSHP